MFADGSLDLRSLVPNNSASPEGDELFADVRLAAAIHRIDGSQSIAYERTARLQSAAPILSTGTPSFAGFFTLRTVGLAEPFAVLDYAEFQPAIATLPTNEEFGLEFILETAARADAEALGWAATSSFGNTMRFEISSPTAGVELEEVFADPMAPSAGVTYVGRATFDIKKLGRSKLDTSWSVAIDGDTWTAESDQGTSLTGTLKPKGKSGRKFTLLPDRDSLKEFIDEFERHLEAESGKQTVVKLKGLKKAKARLKRNRSGTSSKLSLKLDLSVKVKGKKRRGTWKIKLKDDSEV